MPSSSSLALVVAALAAAAAPSHGPSPSPERHTQSGGTVAVYNVAGKVRLVAGSGSAVVVDVARGGADAGQLKVEQGELRGRQTLRVIYPEDRIVYPQLGRWSNTRTRIRDDGTFGDDGGRGSHEIEVRGDGRGMEAWADLTIAVPRGQRLAVHLVAGEATATNVDGELTVDVSAADVSTQGTKGRLVVDAGSGRVRVDGAEGVVLLDTGSGSTDVRGIRGSEFRLDAGSGSFTGEDIDAPTVDIDLGSGRARMSRVRARDLKIESGSGSVEVSLLDDVDDLRIDTGSGSVTLRLPPTLGAELDIDTGSGGISTEVPVTVTRRERDRLIGRIGDGKGRIVIDAGSGGVRLLRSSHQPRGPRGGAPPPGPPPRRGAPAPPRGRRRRSAAVALLELVDAPLRVHEALLAREEGVRHVRDFERDHRVLIPVAQADLLLAGHGRAGDDELPVREVLEDDRVVLGMDVLLHRATRRWSCEWADSDRPADAPEARGRVT